jgi:hypothetical protein
MNDRPTMAELVSAARVHLEGLIPTLADARQRFQTLIAANVLLIVERELSDEEGQLQGEWKLFSYLLDRSGPLPHGLNALRQSVGQANEDLCLAIRAGAFDEPRRFRHVSGMVRTLVERKLEIANPRYLRDFKSAEQ